MDKTLLLVLFGFVALFGALLAARAGLSILTLFFLVLPYPLAIGGEQGGINISVSDIVIAVALTTLLSKMNLRLGGAGQAVIFFLSIAIMASCLASTPQEIALGWGRMVLVALAPLVIFANATDPLRELKRGLIAYCLSTTVLAGFSMVAFVTAGPTASMYTLGIHKNGLGPIFGTAVATTFAGITTQIFQDRRAILALYGVFGACGIGLLLTVSRSGWMGTLAGLIVIMLMTGRVRPAIIGAAVLVPLLALVWSRLPADTVEYATDISTKAHTMQTRFDTIQQALDAFWSNPVLGVGIGLERRVEPHNIIILTLGETGIAGLVAFATMIVAGAGTLYHGVKRFKPDDPERAVLLAGLAAFVLYHVQTLLDVYWRRGVGAMSWACVGVAVAVNAGALRPLMPIESPRRPHLPPQPLA